MGGDCFNCADPATERYTVVLDDGATFTEKLLCDECAAAFRDVAWIELSERAVLTSGGAGDREATSGE